jgi:hypothetical protein
MSKKLGKARMNIKTLNALVSIALTVVGLTACGGGGGGAGTNSYDGGGTSSSMSYSVGGTITGITSGDNLTIANNISDKLVITANGSFGFFTKLADGSAYQVTIITQPTGKNCFISSSSGTIKAANVTTVKITC